MAQGQLQDRTGVFNIFDGTEEHDIIGAGVEAKFIWHRDATKRTRRQWLVNAAFARSQQFSVLHRTEDRLVTPVQPGKRKQVTVDKIGPWKKRRIANLVTATPVFKAQPNNLDQDSVSAARVGSQLLAYYFYTWRYMEMYIKQMGYNVDFANHFVYLNYVENGEKYSTREVRDPFSDEVVLDEDGDPIIEAFPIGDIVPMVLPPERVMCPIDDSPMREKPWVIIVQKRPIEYFTETFENGDMVSAESENSTDTYSLRRIASDNTQIFSNNPEYANELIYLQKPSITNPKGMMVTVANNQVMIPKGKSKKSAVQEWPYKKLTIYPIVHFHGMQESGEFYARSDIEAQIPPQTSLNLLWSILLENADDMVHIKWLCDRGADVDDISDVNERIDYSGTPPTQSDIKSLPEYVFASIDRLERAIQDAQSSHGASQGGAVSGVRSDVHAQNLQDQDMLPLLIQDNLNRVGFEEMGEIILTIAAEKMTEERLLAYIGEDKRYMVQKFKGAMLGDTRKVEVTMENILMRSKGALRQSIMEAAQYGAYTDKMTQQIDADKLKRDLEFAIPDIHNKEMQMHSEMAMRENDKMMEGVPVFVLPQQNHNIHIQVVREFMNTPEFMQLHEEETPTNKETRDRYYQHLDLHTQMKAQALGMFQPRQPEEESRPEEGAKKPERKESE